MGSKSNSAIASKLCEMADVLELQQANPFRVKAYQKAAETLSDMPDDVVALYQHKGLDGLVALPGDWTRYRERDRRIDQYRTVDTARATTGNPQPGSTTADCAWDRPATSGANSR